MLVRSLLERDGGSIIELDDKSYHFKPEEMGGPHLCEVDDDKHFARFISITAGFEMYRRPKPKVDHAPVAAAPAIAQPKPEPVVTAEMMRSVVSEGLGTTEPLEADEGEATAEAVDVSEPSAPADEAEAEAEAEEEVDPVQEALDQDALARVLDDPENATDADAREAFQQLFGREAHKQAKTPSIVKKIFEATKASAGE